jgi:hypothetical protein
LLSNLWSASQPRSHGGTGFLCPLVTWGRLGHCCRRPRRLCAKAGTVNSQIAILADAHCTSIAARHPEGGRSAYGGHDAPFANEARRCGSTCFLHLSRTPPAGRRAVLSRGDHKGFRPGETDGREISFLHENSGEWLVSKALTRSPSGTPVTRFDTLGEARPSLGYGPAVHAAGAVRARGGRCVQRLRAQVLGCVTKYTLTKANC